MNMIKWLIISMLGLIFAIKAQAGEPIAQMTFRVMDDFGNNVTGAPVRLVTFLRWVPGSEFGHDEYDYAKGLTDTNGLVVLTLPSKTGNVRYSVFAEGTFFDNKMRITDATYYRDRGGALRFTNNIGGKWQPWSPRVDLVLKKVINPIPMYAFAYGNDWDHHKVPECGKAIGFDLMKGDWVAPYGKGETSDFIFMLDCKLGGKTSNKYQIFDATLKLSFANEGDGIQSVYSHPLKGSAFCLPRFAPETGYLASWTKATFIHEGETLHEIREDQNYFFRVRTKKDKSGNIVSALYGKIYGMIDYEIRETGNHFQFKYYLNPTSNDRNMEFDPKRNLFTDISNQEKAWDP